jgi:putative salt-induced outer membrane protein YdiY
MLATSDAPDNHGTLGARVGTEEVDHPGQIKVYSLLKKEFPMRFPFRWLPIILIPLSIAFGADDAANPPAKSPLAHESEVGVAVASGNSDTQIYQFKQLTSYTFDSQGLESAKNWDANLRYERFLSDPLAIYVADGWAGDIFIGYDYRTTADAGGRYYLVLGDKKNNFLATELGYRYMYEDHVSGATVPSITSHFVRVYFEGVVALTETASGRAWIELLPDLANGNNFQTNFEASLSVAISHNFSLKAAYLGKFRNTPISAGKKQYDSLITGALLAKF